MNTNDHHQDHVRPDRLVVTGLGATPGAARGSMLSKVLEPALPTARTCLPFCSSSGCSSRGNAGTTSARNNVLPQMYQTASLRQCPRILLSAHAHCPIRCPGTRKSMGTPSLAASLTLPPTTPACHSRQRLTPAIVNRIRSVILSPCCLPWSHSTRQHIPGTIHAPSILSLINRLEQGHMPTLEQSRHTRCSKYCHTLQMGRPVSELRDQRRCSSQCTRQSVCVHPCKLIRQARLRSDPPTRSCKPSSSRTGHLPLRYPCPRSPA